MMATWTQADVDSLQEAMKTGVLTVTYDGPPRRSITYRSLTELATILATAQQAVNAQNGKPNYTLAGTSKGVGGGVSAAGSDNNGWPWTWD